MPAAPSPADVDAPPEILVEEDDPQETTTSPSKIRLWLWLAVVVVALAAIVGFIVAFGLPFTGEEEAAQNGEPEAPVIEAPDPQSVLASTGTANISMSVANCGSCVITAIPADGTAPVTATVSAGVAEFAIPQASTLGLGFTVTHPYGFGSEGGPNVVVLAPEGVSAGGAVTVSRIMTTKSAAVCWAGTVDSSASFAVAVEVFGDGTVHGGLRAWANPSPPVLAAAASVVPDDYGMVNQVSLGDCTTAVQGLA